MCCVHLMAFINHIHEFLSEATDGMQFFRGRARARTRDRACTVDKYACTNAMGDHVKLMQRKKNVTADSDTTSIVPQRFTLISFNKFLDILSVQSVIDAC